MPLHLSWPSEQATDFESQSGQGGCLGCGQLSMQQPSLLTLATPASGIDSLPEPHILELIVWLSTKAKSDAAQPLASIIMPLMMGARLPTTRLMKTPRTSSATALSPNDTKVENCGLYHVGPNTLRKAKDTVKPSIGTMPKTRKDTPVASPDFMAASVPLGDWMPSSSAIM
eukprot:CAMPEP_0115152340 /NCGR_PEP_ID=MMETSP0227-20121206/66110_1 /TAXON_ID=89957 /ORGANISM="Polarella glacialis, Strain CCMP 1383" /LENGTH=170 /DNA_ID=CAMNT_0002562945 /DNA_START=352 /DNA_END=864 /DNA_ORIENTATION=+